jgi:hypothetical protein
MPVHRVEPTTHQALDNLVDAIEAAGEEVASCVLYGGVWVVLTRPAPPVVKPRARKKTIVR